MRNMLLPKTQCRGKRWNWLALVDSLRSLARSAVGVALAGGGNPPDVTTTAPPSPEVPAEATQSTVSNAPATTASTWIRRVWLGGVVPHRRRRRRFW